MKTLIIYTMTALVVSACATPNQMAADAEVKRLCAIDGGIKVYETVKLPANKFNEWGQPNFFRPSQGENALGPEYIYRSEIIYLDRGNPSLRKDRELIFRKADMRLLGEATTYVRGGGDVPGPWQPSAYRCPNALNAEGAMLMNRVFTKQGE